MSSCKDCIQYSVCEYADDLQYEDVERLKNDCPNFKNKADFVEVVRCKDCKNYTTRDQASVKWKGKALHCKRSRRKVNPNDFCSYGEKALKERERE